MQRRIALSLVTMFIASMQISTQAAPLGYTGGLYTQSFDGLPTNLTNGTQTITGKGPHEFSTVTGATGLDGWQLSNATGGLVGTGGSSLDTEFKSQNGGFGSSAGRGVVSFGADASTERALGALSTSNQINSFGLVLVNNSSDTYTEFTLSYTGEQWRRGGIAAPGPFDALNFAYGLAGSLTGSLTNAASLSFGSPNNQASPTEVALNGNDPANQLAVSQTILGLNWGPSQTLVLRWQALDLSGQDDGLAIDNLSFSAAVPEPSTFVLAGLAVAGLICGRRRLQRTSTK